MSQTTFCHYVILMPFLLNVAYRKLKKYTISNKFNTKINIKEDRRYEKEQSLRVNATVCKFDSSY